MILFYVFVTGHWVAGREHFLSAGKIFSPFWELAICGLGRGAGADWWGMVGSYARWIVSSSHYGRCRHLDQDQLLMLQPNQPTRPMDLKKKRNNQNKKNWSRASNIRFTSLKNNQNISIFSAVANSHHHLVVNSLCLLGSINPLLFPAESPDYGKHSAGIPILCQSCPQIFSRLSKAIPAGKCSKSIMSMWWHRKETVSETDILETGIYSRVNKLCSVRTMYSVVYFKSGDFMSGDLKLIRGKKGGN